jgi:hypothetical protein
MAVRCGWSARVGVLAWRLAQLRDTTWNCCVWDGTWIGRHGPRQRDRQVLHTFR